MEVWKYGVKSTFACFHSGHTQPIIWFSVCENEHKFMIRTQWDI